MMINVNGKPQDMMDGASIQDVLAAMGVDRSHLVIEHNGVVLEPEADYAAISVAESDTLEIIRFVGGG